MVSQAAEYALRSVVALGLRPGRCLTAREIAAQTRIPAPYLSKVLRMLVRAGLVASHRGLGGGFDLARPPARMTVLEVVEAVAPIRPDSRCPGSLASRPCPLCGIHHGVDAWFTMLKGELARFTVADLIADPGAVPGGAHAGPPAAPR
ncbi:MAG: Rrf2 family transcriptional regulator [Isosphaeraceae bacterium]